MRLHETLSSYEKSVAGWLDDAKRHVAAVQKLQKAVQDGNLRDIERLRAAAIAAAESASRRAGASEPLAVDAADYLGESGDFLAELKEIADQTGVTLFERDGVIFSYPVLVRPEPDMAAVRIDKKLLFTIRPSVLAALLKKLQAKDAGARPDRFIETLLAAYDYARAKRGIDTHVDMPLSDIYTILTLLPGSDREYTLLDFTRDLYFLDISGVTETKRGFSMSLPASTVSRERRAKYLPFVDRQGREKLYATVKFVPPAGEA
jgi:hypothetical protein